MDILEERFRRTEPELFASEVRYRRLFEAAQDGILLIDAETEEITDVNPYLEQMLGYAKEEFLGKKLWEIGPFKDTIASQLAFSELQNKGYIRYENLPLETKDGRPMDVEFVSNVYMVDGDKVIQCNIRDITARVKAEEALTKAKTNLEIEVKERTAELSQANRQLKYYAAELLRAHEDEKKHIAGELHDQIGQSLTSLKLIMNYALLAPTAQYDSIIKESQALLNELIQQVHDMSLNLRPPMLDILGLLPCLLWHIERYTAQTKIKVAFEHSDINRSFGPDINIAVFRIMQEALTNVARHANVKDVIIHVWDDENEIHLVIKDLGSGFNPAIIPATSSNGLRGMHERAHLLGGSFIIEASPGNGTCLTASMPLKK